MFSARRALRANAHRERVGGRFYCIARERAERSRARSDIATDHFTAAATRCKQERVSFPSVWFIADISESSEGRRTRIH
jgi:hypothetical protein